MRGFLAGLAVLLVFFTTTGALGGAVGQAVLDPERAGAVAEAALADVDLSPNVLARLVPGFEQLEQPQREIAREVATDEATRTAARQVTFDTSRGEVDLQPLRAGLVRGLREAGAPSIASVVRDDTRDSVLNVPAKELERYQDARELKDRALLLGGLATLVLAAVALLASRRRLRTAGSLGISILLATALVGAAYWLLPGLATAASTGDAAQVAAAAIELSRPDVLTILVPVAVLAVLLIAAPLLMGFVRREHSDSRRGREAAARPVDSAGD